MISNNWAKDAACADTIIDFFSQSPTEKKKAKALCGICPVRQLCLQKALDNKEIFGVWGGVDEIELRKNQGVNALGEPHVSTQGKIRCGYCGPLSTKYLTVLERKRTRTVVECSNCGISWTIRRRINEKETNW